ncbi:hypothetical protein QQS21_009713 [Conoideocrella luteorostrata]|uniref:Glucose-methanol-choline oxidoreductase N-terminal domain-containing protein n=1 Tax=Conoideocrella luteorostrata TaxID=1105319 RepID=A0AAJ0CGJ2_9HYPO|nr:hypothetical protein QQS21_009713 [Conoideocrella luteorostrata]
MRPRISVLLLGLSQLITAKFISEPNSSTKYDYVIVGSGAGGGPLAARLATYGHSVLLIEAGDDHGDTFNYQVPLFNLLSSEDPKTAWNFYVNHYKDVTRQKDDSKMTWKKPDGKLYVGNSPPSDAAPLGILYPRAGALGGCTTHNALVAMLPQDADWKHIADLTGDDTWAPDKMRKLFVRLEKNTYVHGFSDGHGFDGWLSTSIVNPAFALTDGKIYALALSIVRALANNLIGAFTRLLPNALELLQDTNSGDNLDRRGLFFLPLALKNGERAGPRDFLMSVMSDDSKKLDIMLNTLVTKVRFEDGSDSDGSPKAIGVEYIQGTSLYEADPRSSSSKMPTNKGTVDAAREVILSGGAYNSPQLLKLSGIGPKEELKKHDIPVVLDLPGVGTNLQDRYEVAVMAENQDKWKFLEGCGFEEGSNDNDPCLDRWRQKDKPLSDRGAYAASLAVGYLEKTSVAENGIPDIFMSPAPFKFKGYYPGYATDATHDKTQLSWLILKGYTRNTAGTVMLKSKNPRDTPDINFNYFDTGSEGSDEDEKALVEAVKLARKAIDAIPKTPSVFTESFPGSDTESDNKIAEYVKREAWGHHASCTCPIGKNGDRMAVLDSKFRVRGVRNLRVVDASVFPKIPGYFIVLPTYMISEKAADAIHQG